MSLSTSPVSSSNDGALDSIRALLARGDSHDSLAIDGPETPLSWAARAGDYVTVSRLLGAGVDASAGRPLHAAALAVRHAIKITRLLLAAGSDPTALDAHGRSAADVAESVGNQRLADLLHAHGASLAGVDPSEAALGLWERNARHPSYLKLLSRFAELCRRPPRPFRDRPRGFRGEGVYRLDFDLNLTAEYLGVDPRERRVRPEDRETLCNAWLDELADEVRDRGYLLVRNVHLSLDDPYSLLLCPTADPFSVIVAHDVDGRGVTRVNGRPRLLDARGVAAELRELSATHPFQLTECGRDALGGRFVRPIAASPGGAAPVACTLGDLCPHLLDLETHGTLETARTSLAEELSRSGEFFLWWG